MTSQKLCPEIERIEPFHRESAGGQALAALLLLALLAGLVAWACAKPGVFADPPVACAPNGVVTSAQVDAAVLRVRRVAQASMGPKLSGSLYVAAKLGSEAGGRLLREAAAEEVRGMQADLAALCAQSRRA